MSSAAFRDPQLSVDVEPILVALGLDWRFTLEGHAGYSLVRLLAASAREKGLAVVPKPLSENPAHAEIIGKKTGAIAEHLRKTAEVIHLADGVDPA